jgi:hypothetical protein
MIVFPRPPPNALPTRPPATAPDTVPARQPNSDLTLPELPEGDWHAVVTAASNVAARSAVLFITFLLGSSAITGYRCSPKLRVV